MNPIEIKGILSNYYLPITDQYSFEKFGAGLIHQTYLVTIGDQRYILQGFNQNVFKYPERIEQNLKLLGEEQDSYKKLPFHLPLPILSKSGAATIKFDQKLFRLFEFVDGQTLQQIQNSNQAYLAAEAYASFSRWAEQFPIDSFSETIPNFHRLDLRYERLQEVAMLRQPSTLEETEILQYYLGQENLIKEYLETIQTIPRRLTHNDTKINNLIFSSDLQKVQAVVDLDTIMPGYLLYDFGDLVRTVASAEEEISQNWDNQQLIPSVFEKLLAGYWSAAGAWMTPEEGKSILLGGEVMTALMGIRFFTDHLEGNSYYQVAYPLQNLHRAKNQMTLLHSMQGLRPELRRIFAQVTQVSGKF